MNNGRIFRPLFICKLVNPTEGVKNLVSLERESF